MRIAPGRQSERSCSCKQQAGYVLNFGCKGTAWSGHFLAQAHKNTAKLSKRQFRGKNYAFGFSTNSTIVRYEVQLAFVYPSFSVAYT